MKQWLRKLGFGGSVNPYLPPRDLQYVGEADFIRVGEKFKSLFIKWGGLQPNHRVLDIGSGNGRMAYPLLSYLNNGSYLGQEIVAGAVNWCHKTYSAHPDFSFMHADIYSQRYNPGGKIKASEYRFPCEDASFDFIFLTSVFTHMLQEDVENYCREIGRLLAVGGRAFITCFLINEERGCCVEGNGNGLSFQQLNEVSYTTTPSKPESAVAFRESFFLEMLAENRLSICGSIHYGRWDQLSEAETYQDVLVVEKR